MSSVDLGRWADALIARYRDRDVNGNALFPISSPDPAEVPDLGDLLVPMDRHPVDFLRRYRPSATCMALGLVSAGWAAPMDSPVRPSAHPDAKRILQVTVIGRGGGTASRIRWPDGSVMDPGPAGFGRVLDVLRGAMRRAAAA